MDAGGVEGSSWAVRARGIAKSFGDVAALDGVDPDVAAGQVHGIVGPNGAGKTTLLGLLLGLSVADRGSLEVLGKPVGLLAVSAGVIAGATGATGSGIEKAQVQQSLATAFAHLYRQQASELNHVNLTEARLRVTASCNQGGGMSVLEGPGNDWLCCVYWHLPDVTDATGQAVYQLDVNPNGRYVADGDGPTEVNGYFRAHTRYGNAPNPPWQFDGNVGLLSATSKGQTLTCR